eukprot:8622334-Pyramimonas_sp.AAC.1
MLPEVTYPTTCATDPLQDCIACGETTFEASSHQGFCSDCVFGTPVTLSYDQDVITSDCHGPE